jgi:hypothetical protein
MPRSDFNGDGIDDLLWRGYINNYVGTWLGDDSGQFIDNSAAFLVHVPGSWQIMGTGYFNNDAYADIVWQGSYGQIGNWFGGPNGTFTINDHLLPQDGWFVAGVGDFNGDHIDEILITGQAADSSRNFVDVVWATNGDFEFSLGPIGELANNWSVAGIGDFNGDGYDDILWRNWTDGRIMNWQSSPSFGTSGVGMTVNNASAAQVQDWHITTVGDFNGDGYDDILWRQNGTGWTGTWLGGPGGVFTINNSSLRVSEFGSYLAQVGDFNGDGNDDLLWRMWNGGTMRTWFGTDSGGFNVGPIGPDVGHDWLLMPDYAQRAEWL